MTAAEPVQDSGPPCAGGRAHDPGAPTWCPACASLIAERLAALPGLVGALEGEAEAGGGAGFGEDRVSGTSGHPSPSSAVDDIDEITRLLEYWEDTRREDAGQLARPARPYARRAAAAVAYLAQHLDGLLGAPYAEEFGRDVTRMHARARRATATDPVRTRKPVPCPSCDLRSLVHADGDAYIGCRSCGRLLTFGEYDTWTRLAAAAEKTRRTA